MNSHRNELDISHNNHLSNNILLFENQVDAICVIDMNGDIIYSNLSTTNLLGYSTDELLNMSFKDFVISEDGLAIFIYYFNKAKESDTQQFIITIKCKDGSIKEIKIDTVSNEKEGQIVSISAFLTHISAENANEEIQPITMGLCESFIENNRDPILLLNLDAIIILANRAFSKLLGWRKENLEGFHILQCPSIPADLIEQMREYFHRHFFEGETELGMLDTIRIDTDGHQHHMMLSITPVQDSNGFTCNWAVHLREITMHKQAEQLIINEMKSAYEKNVMDFADQIRITFDSLKTIIESINCSKSRDLGLNKELGLMIDELVRIEILVNTFSKGGFHIVDDLKSTSA